jgi:hypothetical protein
MAMSKHLPAERIPTTMYVCIRPVEAECTETQESNRSHATADSNGGARDPLRLANEDVRVVLWSATTNAVLDLNEYTTAFQSGNVLRLVVLCWQRLSF